MTTTITLADLVDKMPYDGPSGMPIEDEQGRPDDPRDYEVLELRRTSVGFRALVRGPSEQIDLVVDDVTGCRIYRETEEIED